MEQIPHRQQQQYERALAQLELEVELTESNGDSDDDREEREFEVRSLTSRRRSFDSSHALIFILIFLSTISIVTWWDGHQHHSDTGHQINQLDDRVANIQQQRNPSSFVEVGTDFSEVIGIRRALPNITFKDVNGVPKDPIQIFKDHGYTWGRMRVMVDPDKAHNGGFLLNVDYAVDTAKMLKRYRMKILLAFHYSHQWSNSNHQDIPLTWKSEALASDQTQFEELRDHIYRHTLEVMRKLKKVNAVPDAIQIGNEVNEGILWEPGRLPNHVDNFVNFTKAAKKAIRKALSEQGSSLRRKRGLSAVSAVKIPKIVLHIAAENGKEWIEQWFQNFTSAGGECDIIGLSYLPTPRNNNISHFQATLEYIKRRFPHKQIWIVETAYNWKGSNALSDEEVDQLPYPQTPDGQYGFLNELRSIVEQGIGSGGGDSSTVFYWGSHCTQSKMWLNENTTQQERSYWTEIGTRALFDEDGVALKGIDGLLGK